MDNLNRAHLEYHPSILFKQQSQIPVIGASAKKPDYSSSLDNTRHCRLLKYSSSFHFRSYKMRRKNESHDAEQPLHHSAGLRHSCAPTKASRWILGGGSLWEHHREHTRAGRRDSASGRWSDWYCPLHLPHREAVGLQEMNICLRPTLGCHSFTFDLFRRVDA